jgi:hypothetical protein
MKDWDATDVAAVMGVFGIVVMLPLTVIAVCWIIASYSCN